MLRFCTAAVILAMNSSMAAFAGPVADPLNSPVWDMISKKYLGEGEIVFDDRVKVSVPSIVENQAQVPITADARALKDVKKLVLLTDLNPIQHVMTLHPMGSAPYVSLRMKVEQGTPVRAAAQTGDGVWHVGGVYLDAAGGGCTAPAMARIQENWFDTVGQSQGRIWRDASGLARLRMRVRHPMDTGLTQDNTPAFYIESFDVKRAGGEALAKIEMFEPVSEDPTVTLLLDVPTSETGVYVEGRDNNGSIYRSLVPVPWKSSSLGTANTLVK